MKNPAMKYMELSEHQIKDNMTTNVQHQIQADRSGKIWINVSNNDPRLNINGIVDRIRPVYNHTHVAKESGIKGQVTIRPICDTCHLTSCYGCQYPLT